MGLATALIGIFLLVAALVVWQHAAKVSATLTYGVEDAVEFVLERLQRPVRERLGESGVRRILEWEVFYLQGLAQVDRRHAVETIAGPYGPAIDYIGERIESSLGKPYSPEEIREVLELEVAYLATIGAIGDEAGGIQG